MARHLDREVSPLGIHDVEGIVIDVRQLFGQVDATAARTLNIPDRSHRAADEDHEQPTADGMLGQIVLGEVMLTLPAAAVDDRNVVRLGEPTHAAAEPTCQTHEVRIVELLLGATHQRPPPQPKAASRVAHGVVAVQDDPINAVVGAIQQLG